MEGTGEVSFGKTASTKRPHKQGKAVFPARMSNPITTMRGYAFSKGTMDASTKLQT